MFDYSALKEAVRPLGLVEITDAFNSPEQPAIRLYAAPDDGVATQTLPYEQLVTVSFNGNEATPYLIVFRISPDKGWWLLQDRLGKEWWMKASGPYRLSPPYGAGYDIDFADPEMEMSLTAEAGGNKIAEYKNYTRGIKSSVNDPPGGPEFSIEWTADETKNVQGTTYIKLKCTKSSWQTGNAIVLLEGWLPLYQASGKLSFILYQYGD